MDEYLNCQGFLDGCCLIQLTLFKKVFCVERDVLLGSLERLCDFKLAQPDAIALYPEIDPGLTIVGGVNDQVHHAFFPLVVGFAGLAAAVILVYSSNSFSSRSVSFLKRRPM